MLSSAFKKSPIAIQNQQLTSQNPSFRPVSSTKDKFEARLLAKMALGRLAIYALVLLLGSQVSLGAHGSSHIHIRVHAAHTTGNSKAAVSSSAPTVPVEPPSLSWFLLDPRQFQIASCASQTWEVTRKESSSLLSLYFKSIDAPGDQLIVSTLNGSYPQVLNGSEAFAGVTTDPILGHSIKIEFLPSMQSSVGCKATGKLPTVQLEAVGVQWKKSQVTMDNMCSTTRVMDNAVCSKGVAQDIMYRRARAVLRIDLGDRKCTGWLWGNKGHIVTNHHCIYNQGVVDGARFQFGYETKGCNDDSSKCDFVTCRESEGVVLDGKNGAVKFIASDPIKDFAIVQIMSNPGWYVKAYGYLQIRNGQAKAGEAIYVPQHPKGDAKKIATASDNDPKTPATITKVGIRVDLPDQIARTNLIELSADAKTGSSGSPVISAKDHLVVGLLFSGDCKASSALPCQTLSSRLSQIVEDNDGIAFSP